MNCAPDKTPLTMPRGRRRCSERSRGFLSLCEKTCGAALRQIPRVPDSRAHRTAPTSSVPRARTPTRSAPRRPPPTESVPTRRVQNSVEWSFQADFGPRFWFFLSFFGVLKMSYRLWATLILTKIDELTKREVPKLCGNDVAMHTRLTGRDGSVAGRYKRMWHGRSPRIHIQFSVWRNPGRVSSIWMDPTRWPWNWAISSFCLTRHHTKTWTTQPHGAVEHPRARRATGTRTLHHR